MKLKFALLVSLTLVATALPQSQRFDLLIRGRIAKGMVADIAIFDPKTVRDRSTWDAPNLLSEGVLHVLVNGQFVLRDAKMTGNAPGKFVAKKK